MPRLGHPSRKGRARRPLEQALKKVLLMLASSSWLILIKYTIHFFFFPPPSLYALHLDLARGPNYR